MSWAASGLPLAWRFEQSIARRLLWRRVRRLLAGLWPTSRRELLAACMESALLGETDVKTVIRPVTKEGAELFNDEAEVSVSLHTPSSDHVQLQGTLYCVSVSCTITSIQLHIDGVRVLTAACEDVLVYSWVDVRWALNLHARNLIERLALRELVHCIQHGDL